MSDGTNNQPDEYERRSNDGHERKPDDADREQPPLPIPILTRDDLAPEEAAELDTWQAAWQQGMVSDEELARVMQHIYTQVCARFGLAAVTMDEAMQAVRRLRVYLQQKHNNEEG